MLRSLVGSEMCIRDRLELGQFKGRSYEHMRTSKEPAKVQYCEWVLHHWNTLNEKAQNGEWVMESFAVWLHEHRRRDQFEAGLTKQDTEYDAKPSVRARKRVRTEKPTAKLRLSSGRQAGKPQNSSLSRSPQISARMGNRWGTGLPGKVLTAKEGLSLADGTRIEVFCEGFQFQGDNWWPATLGKFHSGTQREVVFLGERGRGSVLDVDLSDPEDVCMLRWPNQQH
eukprot:TRINITY_DN13454_c0_g2_i4.p1 TRINITY_DN13454_c0_g2~~TRINITY_DN13454_c0_g2_i4.p1  ORF type:complete len:260 (+),score=54.75 TRINITY_DN13454_c0_g2_i4:104-781(+)